MIYCIVNVYYDKIYIGELHDIIPQICKITLTDRYNKAQVDHYKEFDLPSYSKDYTEEEKSRVVIELVTNRIIKGDFIEWKIFREI